VSLTEVSEVAEPPALRQRLARRLTRRAAENWQFCLVTAAAVLLRVTVLLGYPPIMWFNDSYYYITDAVYRTPDNIRPAGYPFFLAALQPFHSLTLVATLQAAMGVAMGVATYAVLRRRGLVWWGATLAALPVLFGAYELLLEHLLGADTLFIALVTLAVIALCANDRPGWKTAAVAGLAIGCGATVRTVGEPLLIIVLIGMLLCRMGWRRAIVLTVAWAVPVLGCVLWFHSQTGRYSLGGATGTFLYGRVSSFAECSKMDPPADIRVLCDPKPPSQRRGAESYIWDGGTPLAKLTGPDSNLRFTPKVSSLALKFAERAIEKQPLSYLSVVVRDTWRTFGWKVWSSDSEGSGPTFQFRSPLHPVPKWAQNKPGDPSAQRIYSARVRYAGPSGGVARVVSPWASFVRVYAKVFIFRGFMLGLVLAAGLAGIALRWRRREGGRGGGPGPALLPWLVAALLIVLPPMTAGFSYRYVAAAVPLACLAAGLAFAPASPRLAPRGWGGGGPPPPRGGGGPPPPPAQPLVVRAPPNPTPGNRRRSRTLCRAIRCRTACPNPNPSKPARQPCAGPPGPAAARQPCAGPPSPAPAHPALRMIMVNGSLTRLFCGQRPIHHDRFPGSGRDQLARGRGPLLAAPAAGIVTRSRRPPRARRVATSVAPMSAARVHRAVSAATLLAKHAEQAASMPNCTRPAVDVR
jgi:hypothetical protein